MGCSAPSWLPDVRLPSASAPAATIRLESEPSGAEAKTSLGPTCRTPCTHDVTAATDFTVTFSLAGYVLQDVRVTPAQIGDPREGRVTKFDPDPVYAQLELAPSAPPKKKGAVQKNQ
jgi:hypothetical protein